MKLVKHGQSNNIQHCSILWCTTSSHSEPLILRLHSVVYPTWFCRSSTTKTMYTHSNFSILCKENLNKVNPSHRWWVIHRSLHARLVTDIQYTHCSHTLNTLSKSTTTYHNPLCRRSLINYFPVRYARKALRPKLQSETTWTSEVPTATTTSKI